MSQKNGYRTHKDYLDDWGQSRRRLEMFVFSIHPAAPDVAKALGEVDRLKREVARLSTALMDEYFKQSGGGSMKYKDLQAKLAGKNKAKVGAKTRGRNTGGEKPSDQP